MNPIKKLKEEIGIANFIMDQLDLKIKRIQESKKYVRDLFKKFDNEKDKRVKKSKRRTKEQKEFDKLIADSVKLFASGEYSKLHPKEDDITFS